MSKTYRRFSSFRNAGLLKEVYERLADCPATASPDGEDLLPKAVLDSQETADVSASLFEATCKACGSYRSLNGIIHNASRSVCDMLNDAMSQRVLDSLVIGPDSPVAPADPAVTRTSSSGLGTLLDPGVGVTNWQPLMLSPYEASSVYASGGLPRSVIDRKAGGLVCNGLAFKCEGLNQNDLDYLADYAIMSGFVDALREALTDALVYGGAFLFPTFADDRQAGRYAMAGKFLDNFVRTMPRGGIVRWQSVDRWCAIFTPQWSDLLASDFMHPSQFYIPQGGMVVSTDRCAMLRPCPVSYWGAMQQLGWGTSDYSGWLQDFYGYWIMAASLSDLARQSSLIYNIIPATPALTENGIDPMIKQIVTYNEQRLREADVLHPKAISSIGELKVVDRTLNGFSQMYKDARLNLASATEIPVSLLFPDEPQGLASDRALDFTHKRGEMLLRLWRTVEREVTKVARLMAFSCFGGNSEQARHLDGISVSLDVPTPKTASEAAEGAKAYAESINKLVISGYSIEEAAKVLAPAFPDFEQPREEQAPQADE